MKLSPGRDRMFPVSFISFYTNAHYKLSYQNFWNHLSTFIWQFRMLQFIMLVSIRYSCSRLRTHLSSVPHIQPWRIDDFNAYYHRRKNDENGRITVIFTELYTRDITDTFRFLRGA